MGHKNSTVTLNRYAHSLTEHKKAKINKLWNKETKTSKSFCF